MNYIFWFNESSSVYWHGIIMAIAAAAAVLAAAGFRRAEGKKDSVILLSAVIGIPLAVVLSRIVFWFFSQAYFNGFKGSLEALSNGGHSLLGAMLGVLLAVLLSALILRIDDVAAVLDAVAPAAALGLCIGRLSGYFSLDDRGKIIETETVRYFPFAVFDPSSGNWRLSVFTLEAIAAGVIFIACTILFAYVYNGRSRIRGGNVMLLFLSLFGVTQGTLESMRLDSLFMNTLGFVRINQIASLVLIVFVLVVYSVTSIKNIGFRLLHIVIWVVSLGLLGLAFYMEFRIHSAVLMRNYAVMSSCLAVVSCLSFRLFVLTYSKPKSNLGLCKPLGGF